MSKITLAKAVIGLGSALGIGAALAAVWGVGCFFVWWYSAHFISFAIIVGGAVGIGSLIGLVCAIGWALDTLHDAKVEEEKEQKRSEHEKKMTAYKAKHGQDSNPRTTKPIDHKKDLIYHWDEPPRIDSPHSTRI